MKTISKENKSIYRLLQVLSWSKLGSPDKIKDTCHLYCMLGMVVGLMIGVPVGFVLTVVSLPLALAFDILLPQVFIVGSLALYLITIYFLLVWIIGTLLTFLCERAPDWGVFSWLGEKLSKLSIPECLKNICKPVKVDW